MVRAEEPIAITNKVAIEATLPSSATTAAVLKMLVTLRLVEVDATALQRRGFDFSLSTALGVDAERMSQLRTVTDKVMTDSPDAPRTGNNAITPCGSFPRNHPFFALVHGLQVQNLATELCAPNIVTEAERVTTFQSGSEFPVGRAPDGKSIMRFAGTKIDVLTRPLPNERVHVKFALSVSEIDASRSVKSGGLTIPAVKTRECVTEFDSRLGETWVCSGMTEKRSVAKGRFALAAPKSEHEFRQLLLVTTQSIDAPMVAEKPSSTPRPTDSQPPWHR